jgi:hypothetical protein|tara:strand:- start:336 stop:734 length:399 start_codon:yes stop_codon:yes gene_type:complete
MDNKINDKLSKRFLTGLKKYNLDYEEIKKKWYYMGGENGIHRKYLNKNFNDDTTPEHKDFCICGHKIKNNCFITDGEFVLSIGESCVNKFVRKLNKVCEVCGTKHRNRKNDICNSCRKDFYFNFKKVLIIFD